MWMDPDLPGENLRHRCEKLEAAATKFDSKVVPAPHPDASWMGRWRGWKATLPSFCSQIDDAIIADRDIGYEHDPKVMQELGGLISQRFGELQRFMDEWEATKPPEDFLPDLQLKELVKVQAGPVDLPVEAAAGALYWAPGKAFTVGALAGAGATLVVLGVKRLFRRHP